MFIKNKLNKDYKNFESKFQDLLRKAQEGAVSLEALLTALSGKGKLFFLVFLSMGFAQIPGIAIPFGGVIAYLGIKIALLKDSIWVPKSIRQKKIPSYFLIKITHFVLKFLKLLKRYSSPRYIWISHHFFVLNGCMVALVGICMAISPPVPLGGWIGSLAIFLLAIGLINDDGIYILLGYVHAIIYFVAVIFLLKLFSISQMIEWVKSCKEHLFR